METLELLFSKTYSTDIELSEEEIKAERAEVRKHIGPKKSFAEFMKDMERIEYREIPNIQNDISAFIKRSIALSEELELDLEIRKTKMSIDSRFLIPTLELGIAFLEPFVEVLSYCSTITMAPLKGDDSQIELILSLHTHDKYLDGKRRI